jgi:hypothetical protein
MKICLYRTVKGRQRVQNKCDLWHLSALVMQEMLSLWTAGHTQVIKCALACTTT